MTSLKNSTIETFRKRFHGNSRLRLLALNDDGQTLAALGALERGFYVGRNADTQEGAQDYSLTVDTVYTPDLTSDLMRLTYMVDLYDPTDISKYKRFRVDTDTPPNLLDWRYVLSLQWAHGDKKPVSGVYVPDDEPATEDVVLLRYVHSQNAPSSVWTVNHNLGERPIIGVFDNLGEQVLADITHISNNQAQIIFAAPATGQARCI